MVSRAPTKASANNQLLCKLRMSKIKWNGFQAVQCSQDVRGIMTGMKKKIMKLKFSKKETAQMKNKPFMID